MESLVRQLASFLSPAPVMPGFGRHIPAIPMCGPLWSLPDALRDSPCHLAAPDGNLAAIPVELEGD